MSLVSIVDDKHLADITQKIKNECIEFKNLSKGSKAQAADRIFQENAVIKELGAIAVVTIERLAEKDEENTNKIQVMENELKDLNSYNEEKINSLINKKAVVKQGKYERAKRELMKTIQTYSVSK